MAPASRQPAGDVAAAVRGRGYVQPATDRAPRLGDVRFAWLAAVVAGVSALAVYLATLNPTLPPGDSGDLITAASTLGVAHPPGYPLFAMIGHLFTLLPFGSPAYRVNLMSAVLDATAVAIVAALVHRIAVETVPRKNDDAAPAVLAAIAGLSGALFLAFATEFWSYSLVAEVFALNNTFAALLLLLAFTWYWNPDRRWVLRAFFLTSGLAFCNQQTIVLLAPGLGTLLIAGILRLRARRSEWQSSVVRELSIGVAFLLAGLLPYLYLPLAATGNPPALWGDPRTLERFIAVVTRSDYGSFSLVSGGRHGEVFANLTALATNLSDSFGPAGLLLAALGLWWLARRRPAAAIAVSLSFLVTGPLFLMYANPPLGGLLSGVFARFYILPSVPLAVMVGCGAFHALVRIRSGVTLRWALRDRMRLAAAALAGALFIAFAVGPAVARYPSVDQSSNYMTINFTRDLLEPLDQDAILLAEGDTAVLATWYTQNVEDYRPDVVVIAVPLLGFQWYIDEFRRQHPDVSIPFDAIDAAGQPVTERVVNANFAARPVYYVGIIDEAFPAGYVELRAGFARKFVRAGTSDPFDFVRANLERLASYQFPERGYPPTTWEYWESTFYGGAAFDLANGYESSDVAAAVTWYRKAILLGPSLPAAYKNLAILLSANGGDPLEEADLLETYLQLAPQDPEAAAIREAITRLREISP